MSYQLKPYQICLLMGDLQDLRIQDKIARLVGLINDVFLVPDVEHIAFMVSGSESNITLSSNRFSKSP